MQGQPLAKQWSDTCLFREGCPGSPYPFHVVFPRNRHLSQRLRIFIDWLAEMFGELDFAGQVS